MFTYNVASKITTVVITSNLKKSHSLSEKLAREARLMVELGVCSVYKRSRRQIKPVSHWFTTVRVLELSVKLSVDRFTGAYRSAIMHPDITSQLVSQAEELQEV
ncbi:hypothetical protein TWF970_006125 [Orbilia oligospora]|uniref:Uncharacterized protein n=1 Tax=Orbilia oligospora TaxID=2813651 RepID=A0A7C8RBI4_ORBOL|nr:hypothetical protein TWF970_006125 [Orbilia oligospora]